MALREEFEKTGNWLFQWRSYLPLLLLAMFFVALGDYRYPGGSETLHKSWCVGCLFVSFLGLAIRVFTIGHVPKGTSGRNTKSQVADTLNTSGMYSVVRNPLYLGNFFMALGLALFVNSLWVAVTFVVVFWFYYERIMFAEEEFLRRKFGDAYIRWAETTPVFIPRLRNYRKPDLPFSWKKVLRQEHDGFFAVISLMFLMETMEAYNYRGSYGFDTVWVLLAGAAFAVWLVLKGLKLYTDVLKERPAERAADHG